MGEMPAVWGCSDVGRTSSPSSVSGQGPHSIRREEALQQEELADGKGGTQRNTAGALGCRPLQMRGNKGREARMCWHSPLKKALVNEPKG